MVKTASCIPSASMRVWNTIWVKGRFEWRVMKKSPIEVTHFNRRMPSISYTKRKTRTFSRGNFTLSEVSFHFCQLRLDVIKVKLSRTLAPFEKSWSEFSQTITRSLLRKSNITYLYCCPYPIYTDSLLVLPFCLLPTPSSLREQPRHSASRFCSSTSPKPSGRGRSSRVEGHAGAG